MLKTTSILMALAASLALAAPLVSHAGSEQYIYKASETTYSDLVSSEETPVGHVAPLGYFFVRPLGTSFTLNVDDRGTTGDPVFGYEVYVHVHRLRPERPSVTLFEGCMPVRQTRTITGAKAGAEVVIWIEMFGPGLTPLSPTPGVCSGMATAGIATVTGIR